MSARMTMRRVGLALAAALLGCSGARAIDATTPDETAAATTSWVGTWAVSPQNGGSTFANQTLRQVVHTSIGGTAARVQLSNVFGSQAIVVSDVHIAQRAASGGAAVNASSDQVVTFGGATSTTIAAGAIGVSDAVAFPVAALSDVAVSFYLPQSTGAATFHQQGTATIYYAAGDVAGNATLTNPATAGSYFFLTNVDVQNAAALGAVVTLGASITDGVGSNSDDNRRWPNDLATRLVDAGLTVGVLDQGISGNDLLQDGAGPSAIHRFSRDVLAQHGVKWVIFSDDPINDLGGGDYDSGALIAGLQQLVASAHGSGLQFWCSTLTPFKGAGYWTQSGENGRQAINAFIRGSSSGCDAIVDQDTATHDPANVEAYLPAYDSGDHLHPNEAGLQAIANAVDLTRFGASPPAAPVISLRAHANGKYVTAENAGASSLIANRSAIGTWEMFDALDQGSGDIALRAHANGKYVTAENAGAAALIANRSAIGLWETFQLIHNGDGSIALRARADSDYVTAESAGAAPLIANRSAIGPWEEFDLITD